MRASEIREKTDEELDQLLNERMDDLMQFRMQMATGVVDNVRGAREARRDIARVKTIMLERKRASESSLSKEKA